MSEIGKKIRELRIKNNMTQAELGALLGVKKSAVQKYEAGAAVNLRADKIKILCSVFHVLPRYFIFDSDDEFLDVVFNGNASVVKPIEPVVARAIEAHFGMAVFRMLARLSELNLAGVSRVNDYILDILKIDEYKKRGE